MPAPLYLGIRFFYALLDIHSCDNAGRIDAGPGSGRVRYDGCVGPGDSHRFAVPGGV